MPTLTLRKLIKFGDGGIVITVPIAWIRYYGLRAGDTVEVIANGELTIRPLLKAQAEKIAGGDINDTRTENH